jgi:hypothetical protein
MALYPKIKARHAMALYTEKKDYLPIEGKNIPGRLIKLFDDSTTTGEVTCVAGAFNTDDGADKRKAYKSTACRKATINTAANLTFTYTPAAAIDLVNISSKVNNYATIKQSGRYKTSGTSYKDTMFIILNIGHYYDAAAATPATFKVICYAGTRTATLTTAQTLANITAYERHTYQMAPDSNYFTYAAGFLDADWEAITKIDIQIIKGNQILNLYIHNLNIALPKYAADVLDSYYPEITATNAYFFSEFFGDDANAGTRAAPVKTIEKAFALIDAAGAGFIYAVSLDSEIYHPMALDYTSSGIQQTLDRDTKIIADYLEMPTISAKGKCKNTNRVGARENYRSKFSIPTATVHKTPGSGDYTSIYTALSTEGDGAVIEVLDDGEYDETALLFDTGTYTVQAAPGKKPIWKCTAGNSIIRNGGGMINIFGIILKGNAAATDETIKIGSVAAAATPVIQLEDCSIVNSGNSSATGKAIILDNSAAGAGTATLKITNCLFTGNGERTRLITGGTAVFGNVYIDNCLAYLEGAAYSIFVSPSKAASPSLNFYITSTECYGTPSVGNYFIPLFVGGANDGTAAVPSNVYMLFNKSDCGIYVNDSSNLGDFYCLNNYFLSSNIINSVQEFMYFYIDTATGVSTVSVSGNIFYNISGNSTYGILYPQSGYTAYSLYVNNNLFINCLGCAFKTPATAPDTYSYDNNVFINCDEAIRLRVSSTLGNEILVNNTIGINGNTFTATVSASIIYNSPDAGTVNKDALCSTEDPAFIDAENLNLGWYFDSVIEDLFVNYGSWLYKFMNPAGAFTLEFKFFNLEGAPGQTISTAASTIKPTYCDINNWTVATNNILGLIDCQYCFLESNGIGNRLENTDVKGVGNFLKYNIYDENNTAIILKAGCIIDHITVLNGNYGFNSIFYSFYNIDVSDFLLDYVSITNSIFSGNTIYDYYSNIPTDYCAIGKRYYAASEGENDISDKPALNENYYPSTIFEGEVENSNVYCAASVATENIGARYINKLFSQLDYTEDTFEDNPYILPLSTIPINVQANTDLDGNYDATVDAWVDGYRMEWNDDALISVSMMAILISIFKTSWIVGFSFDDGATWNYFSVILSEEFSIKQMLYLNDTLPYGETSLELHKKPSVFDVDDFIIDNMEA